MKKSDSSFKQLISDIREYISSNILLAKPKYSVPFLGSPNCAKADVFAFEEMCLDSSIEEFVKIKDESYVEMLLRKIDEKGITDADCYKKAQINKANFNKIKNMEGYRAKKTTLIALGLALELTEQDMEELLKKAGYALSFSSEADLIIRYCLIHNIFDIDEINDILFSFDQELLGAGVRE